MKRHKIVAHMTEVMTGSLDDLAQIERWLQDDPDRDDDTMALARLVSGQA